MILEVVNAVLVTAFVIAGSAVIHEFGHEMVARSIGWKPAGWRIRVFGAQCRFELPAETKPLDWAVVAAGGLEASLGLMVMGVLLVPQGWPWEMLAAINCGIFVVNALPIRGLDGYYIWRTLT